MTAIPKLPPRTTTDAYGKCPCPWCAVPIMVDECWDWPDGAGHCPDDACARPLAVWCDTPEVALTIDGLKGRRTEADLRYMRAMGIEE